MAAATDVQVGNGPVGGSAQRGRTLAAALLSVLLLVASAGCANDQSSRRSPSEPTTVTPSAPATSLSPSQSSATTSRASTPAVEASRRDYIEFSRALDILSQEGGADQLPDYLGRYLTPSGNARQFLLDEARALRGSGAKWDGSTEVRGFEVIYSDLDADVPLVDLQVCVDQSNVKVVTEAGPSTELGRRADRVGMQYDRESGHWKVDSLDYSAGTMPDLCKW